MKSAFLPLLALASPAAAQAFVVDDAKIPSGPGIDSRSENVDFGDIDLDGDWDVAVADGDEDFSDQNRIWVNEGGIQGGTIGFFTDETAARAPAINDASHDVELADIDGDGDLDLHVSNTSNVFFQGNKWWVNAGGGFYADETSTRWVGLGAHPSSVPPSQVLSDGSFIAWSGDSDFGDLDNDGDLDLVHSSYGGAYGGQMPSRIFLNDGDGFFSEFNPSGFQLTVNQLANGDPGLWCDGVQQHNTTDGTGAFCDVATAALDLDVGDVDGDFDLDVLLGDRHTFPRMFANRLDASGLAPAAGGGALGFRDVTGPVFPDGYAFGTGHYEQELGDMDRDGDLDVLGVNWQSQTFAFNEITLENDGAGLLSGATALAGSGSDDDEGDFLDYDNDGDLDVYVANFSGPDRLYRNDWTPGGSFSFTEVDLPPVSDVHWDADAADTDADGDYDVLTASGFGQPNHFLRNVTEIADTHAPYLPAVETIGDQTAAAAPVPVRALVYDNAPYYVTWYNDTELQVEVDGVALPPIAATSSAGQVFRAELPGNLVGAVDYRFASADEYGNTGTSATESYAGSTGLAFALPYGAGTAGTLGGTPPTVAALSVPFGDSTLYLAGHSDAPPGTTGFFVIGGTKLAPPVPIPGLVLAHVGPPFVLVQAATTDASGDAVLAAPIPPTAPGASVFAQFTALDPTAAGELLSTSAGLELVTQ